MLSISLVQIFILTFLCSLLVIQTTAFPVTDTLYDEQKNLEGNQIATDPTIKGASAGSGVSNSALASTRLEAGTSILTKKSQLSDSTKASSVAVGHVRMLPRGLGFFGRRPSVNPVPSPGAAAPISRGSALKSAAASFSQIVAGTAILNIFTGISKGGSSGGSGGNYVKSAPEEQTEERPTKKKELDSVKVPEPKKTNDKADNDAIDCPRGFKGENCDEKRTKFGEKGNRTENEE